MTRTRRDFAPWRGKHAREPMPAIDLMAHEIATAAAVLRKVDIRVGRDVSVSSAIRLAMAGAVRIARGEPQRLAELLP